MPFSTIAPSLVITIIESSDTTRARKKWIYWVVIYCYRESTKDGSSVRISPPLRETGEKSVWGKEAKKKETGDRNCREMEPMMMSSGVEMEGEKEGEVHLFLPLEHLPKNGHARMRIRREGACLLLLFVQGRGGGIIPTIFSRISYDQSQLFPKNVGGATKDWLKVLRSENMSFVWGPGGEILSEIFARSLIRVGNVWYTKSWNLMSRDKMNKF